MATAINTPIQFPCSVCNAWLLPEAFGMPQKSNEPIICDGCRKAIQRENDDQQQN